jgi:Flp pilus assembly pilin Flp
MKPIHNVATLIRRWVHERSGDDLIEYVLLASFVGLTGVLGFQLLSTNMNSVYSSWDTGVQSVWQPPPPNSSE